MTVFPTMIRYRPHRVNVHTFMCYADTPREVITLIQGVITSHSVTLKDIYHDPKNPKFGDVFIVAFEMESTGDFTNYNNRWESIIHSVSADEVVRIEE